MGISLRIALIADVFPPMRTSGAVQLRDLSLEFVKQGHKLTALIPSAKLDQPWLLEDMDGVQVLRLKSPRTKDIGYARRTIGELLMPFTMLRNMRKSPLAEVQWDGIVTYAPSIFLGPIANALKKKSGCRNYLIIRDIFPQWAVDMELLGTGLPYRFLKSVESYLYSVADIIGVQTPANLAYFDNWSSKSGCRVEVLQNWLAEEPNTGCSIVVADGPLGGRKIFVYAGNMGTAQGMGILIDLAERFCNRGDIGFLFVGRGSDAQLLREEAKARKLDNVVFHQEIEPCEIPGLYAQCHVGLVVLDPRHTTHNIPGKFLSYMQAGLPVLASINSGNDLAEIIERERVGKACSDCSVETLHELAEELMDNINNESDISSRCKLLSPKLFSPEVTVRQITAALAN